MPRNPLPIPPHFDPDRLDRVWRVPYEQRAREAIQWSKQHNIQPAGDDTFRVGLVLVDVQNTFCVPEFELYVGGRSGTGAVDDNRRLSEFIYRNLAILSRITLTLDTHQAMQIFHSMFLVDEYGEHPPPLTLVTADAVEAGKWRFNRALADSLGVDPQQGHDHLEYYTRQLRERGKFDLTIWPYHAMLGGIGHALVSGIEEAVFYHTVARQSQPQFVLKGDSPFTEHYSAIGPEVAEGPYGAQFGSRNEHFIRMVEEYDAVLFAGQAKSHCVAWTVEDTLADIQSRDPALASKVYLLEDCCSPVVVPDVIDYSEQADRAFERFSAAGMNVVQSTRPVADWPGGFANAFS